MAFSWGPTKVTQYPRAFLCIEKHILYFSTVFSIQIYEMKYQHVPNNWAEHMCHNWMCVLTFKQQWEMAKLVSIAVGSIHVKVGVLVIYHCIISHPKRCCCWVAKLYLTLCDPMDCSTPGSSVLNCLPEFAQIHVCCVSDAIWPSHPLPPLLLPSTFPSIRVFSNEPALHIRWSKDWSLSFSNSPSNEYSGLISFRMG